MPGKIKARLHRGFGMSSRLIEWFGGKGAVGFSHIDAVLPQWAAGHHWKSKAPAPLLGARFEGGVAIRPGGYLNAAGGTFMSISVSEDEEHIFYNFLLDQLGKPYDWRSIVAFMGDRDWRDDKSWFCSELFLAGLEHAGTIPPLYAPTNRLTPNDAALILSVLK
jgi:hypothetical protein